MKMTTDIYGKPVKVHKSGLFTKLIKGGCIMTFPVLTSIFVAPRFVRDTYNTMKTYKNVLDAQNNIIGK